MPIVVGISLRTAGKIYYFDPGTERFLIGERVVVETVRGLELGTVKMPSIEIAEDEIVAPLKPVLRHATVDDIGRNTLNREREARAFTVCKGLVEKLCLPMRLIDAQYTLDNTHLLIHFLAEHRVDFRELVRELARELHTRIELRQVGVRDEAKLLGGYGICGRKLCCSAFLTDFAPVAISMAKDQGLALNPQKISGMCGRLMCCLAFECDQYRVERADLPRVNTMVETAQGVGRVTKLNVMTRQVEVTGPDFPAPTWFSADELIIKQPAHGCCGEDGAAPCGGGCHRTAESPVVMVSDESPEPEDFAVMVDEAQPALSHSEDAEGPEGRQRTHRRRRKRPSGAQPESAHRPADVSSAQESGSSDRPKHPRRRKPRPTKPGVEPALAAVATESGATGAKDPRQTPPNRYRPRRRRPKSPNSGAEG